MAGATSAMRRPSSPDQLDHEHEYEHYCRTSPRRERLQRERLKAQRLQQAKRPGQRLVRARTPPQAGRASLEVRRKIQTGGVPGYPGHPDTKTEMDPRQHARMQKIIGTMSAFSQLAIEEAEAELAEAAAEREWADVTEAEEELRLAMETGNQRAIKVAQGRLDAEKEEAETAQRQAAIERKEADVAAANVAEEKARAEAEQRGGKARLPGTPMAGRPDRPAHWVKGEDLAAYYEKEQSATRLAALLRIVNNDPSLITLDWSKLGVHDGVAQQLGHALRNNTHLWRLDLRFNADFTDLACGCGKARDCAATGSLERELAQTCVRKPSHFDLQLSSATSSIGHRRAPTRPHKLVNADALQVLRVELVGTGVSGTKASALHAICRKNAVRAVESTSLHQCRMDSLFAGGCSATTSNGLCSICMLWCAPSAGNDPNLRLLDWDAMRVDSASLGELARALHSNTHLRQLRLQRNRELTDDDIDVLEEAITSGGCGVTEVLCVSGTGVTAAKASYLSQQIDVRRLRANDPSLTELTWGRRESSDIEHLEQQRMETFLREDGADALLRTSGNQRVSEQLLVNRRTCKLLGQALRGTSHLRVIDFGENPQLNDIGAAYIIDALPESKVVRVWAIQTGITEETKQRIDRLCVENALRQLGEDDPTLFALHWFGLSLTDSELRQRAFCPCSALYCAVVL
jgi:hypothetical protein